MPWGAEYTPCPASVLQPWMTDFNLNGKSMTGRQENAFEAMVLSELGRLHEKVDKGIQQGRETREELRMLCKELGITGTHGRLPIVEQRQANHEQRIAAIETEQIEAGARHKLIAAVASLVGGSVGGTFIALIARLVHL